MAKPTRDGRSDRVIEDGQEPKVEIPDSPSPVAPREPVEVPPRGGSSFSRKRQDS